MSVANQADGPAGLVIELWCPACGYDLRGVTSRSCPECGEAFDPDELSRSQIPWTSRARIGRLRAYWGTVLMVTLRPARLHREIARPVGYADARWFQVVTIGHVMATALVLTAVLYVAPHCLQPTLAIERAAAWVWPVVLAHMLLLCFLFAATGVHTYWFHPRSVTLRRQNRAVALAYYCCAPLAWTPLAFMLFGIGAVLDVFDWSFGSAGQEVWVAHIAATFGAAVVVLQFTLLWTLPTVLLRKAVRTGGARETVLAVALPLLWLALAVLIFVAVPAAIAFAVLAFDSLL